MTDTGIKALLVATAYQVYTSSRPDKSQKSCTLDYKVGEVVTHTHMPIKSSREKTI